MISLIATAIMTVMVWAVAMLFVLVIVWAVRISEASYRAEQARRKNLTEHIRKREEAIRKRAARHQNKINSVIAWKDREQRQYYQAVTDLDDFVKNPGP